jgi:pimeloyl-ACP methyl ester carboxylesterase
MMLGMPEAIEPFTISTHETALADLRSRLRRTRWPERETVAGWSQGVPLDYLQGLCRYWADGYDWPGAQARLNQIPQFTTTIDGLDIHFLHVRSADPGAVPLLMTHGWPGSFLEFEQVLGPLADPQGHGHGAADSFHLVVPSLPGYAFSGKPAAAGWDVHRIARAWAELMTRLGYQRFLAEGSDWGTSVSTSLALQHPDRLLGLHLVPPLVAPDRTAADLTEAERMALADLDERARTGSGYSAMHGTRPQTIGYSLLDSPAGAVRLDRGEAVGLDRSPRPPRPGTVRRSGAGQHRAVLVHRHRGVLGPAVLGEHRRGRRVVHHHDQRHDRRPGRVQRVPEGSAAALAPLGRAPIQQHRLLERARPGRALRRLGTARAVRLRSPRGRPGLHPRRGLAAQHPAGRSFLGSFPTTASNELSTASNTSSSGIAPPNCSVFQPDRPI